MPSSGCDVSNHSSAQELCKYSVHGGKAFHLWVIAACSNDWVWLLLMNKSTLTKEVLGYALLLWQWAQFC